MPLDREKYRSLMDKITLQDIETMIGILELFLEQSEKVERVIGKLSRYEKLYGGIGSERDFMKLLFSMMSRGGLGGEEKQEAVEISDEEAEKVLKKLREEEEESE